MAGMAAAPSSDGRLQIWVTDQAGNVNSRRENTKIRIEDGSTGADFLNRSSGFYHGARHHRMAACGYLFLGSNGYVARLQDIDTPEYILAYDFPRGRRNDEHDHPVRSIVVCFRIFTRNGGA